MKPRIEYGRTAPQGLKAMRGLESYVRQSGLEDSLLELVKTRASQINGCAYCVDIHTKDARAQGEHEQRLYAVYELARRHFSEKELVDLTLAIVAINGWNRLAISFRTAPGTYNRNQRKAREDSTNTQASQRKTGQEAHA